VGRFKAYGLTAVLVTVVLVVASVVYGKLTSNSAPAAVPRLSVAEQGGAPNLAENQALCSAEPVNCATGEFWEQVTDYLVPGRGVPLDLTQTYVSADASRSTAFGYGWLDSYGMSLTPPDAAGTVTVRQEDGAVVTFTVTAKGSFTAEPRVKATLSRNKTGDFTFTRDSQQVRYVFSATGRLVSERDLNGETTTLHYGGSELKSVTDAAGRALTFVYQDGRVVTVSGPMGATMHLAYSPAENLVWLTDPAGRKWHFGYGPGHLLTSITDPRGLLTAVSYSAEHRVSAVAGRAAAE
jgi:YD repeat-containing protein